MGSKLITRTLHQTAEIYPNARVIRFEYDDGKCMANIYCPDLKQNVNVRSEIVDSKFYVSFSEVKECKENQ